MWPGMAGLESTRKKALLTSSAVSCVSWRAAECDAPGDCSASAGSMLARSAGSNTSIEQYHKMARLDSAAVRLDNPLLRAWRAPAMLPRGASRRLALQQAQMTHNHVPCMQC